MEARESTTVMLDYSPDLETRMQRARQACLALYIDEPTAESARLLVAVEETIGSLRFYQKHKDAQPEQPPESE